MFITSSKNVRFNIVPSQGIALSRILNHCSSKEFFFNFDSINNPRSTILRLLLLLHLQLFWIHIYKWNLCTIISNVLTFPFWWAAAIYRWILFLDHSIGCTYSTYYNGRWTWLKFTSAMTLSLYLNPNPWSCLRFSCWDSFLSSKIWRSREPCTPKMFGFVGQNFNSKDCWVPDIPKRFDDWSNG